MKKKIDYKNKESSFTLIELLMVISIITLLASVLFSYIGSAHAKTRDAVRLSDIKQIGTAANLYYEDTGILPTQIGPGNGGLVPKYLPSEPKDPKTGISYSFTRSSNTLVVGGKFETQMIEDDKDFKIIATAVGDVSPNILCSSQFASSTGCSAGVISGQILGITGGYNKSNNRVIPPVDSISDCSEIQINKNCPSGVSSGCYCGGGILGLNNNKWQIEVSNYGNWYDASGYCSNLISNGFNDWRLPELIEINNELNLIDNDTGVTPIGFQYDRYYWTNTESEFGDGTFLTGYWSYSIGSYPNSKDAGAYFRCVR